MTEQSARISAIAGVLAVVAVLAWASQNDEKRITAAQEYEKCVMREYNTTPTKWYAEHGEYPVCQTAQK